MSRRQAKILFAEQKGYHSSSREKEIPLKIGVSGSITKFIVLCPF
jgi:hypothetical protein